MSFHPYPSLPRTAGLLVATLLAAAGLAAATFALFPDWPEIVRMAIPTELALALGVVWAVRRSGLPWRQALFLGPLDRRLVGPLVLVIVGAVAVFSEIYVIVQRIVAVPPAFERALEEMLRISGPVDFAATALVAVVLAPVLEEALFRGVILQGLARRHGPRAAAAWTGLFFALFHLYNPWQVLPTFFLGLVLAWLVLTTGSLVAAIVVHAGFNAISLALFAAPVTERTPSDDALPWAVAGIVALLVAGGFALLRGLAALEERTGGGWFAAVPPGAPPPLAAPDGPAGEAPPPYALGATPSDGGAARG